MYNLTKHVAFTLLLLSLAFFYPQEKYSFALENTQKANAKTASNTGETIDPTRGANAAANATLKSAKPDASAKSGDANVGGVADASGNLDANSPEVVRFSFKDVINEASRQAGKSYRADSRLAPPELRSLDANQWSSIKFKESDSLWYGDNIPSKVDFFYPGFIYDRMIYLNIIEDGKVTPYPFNPDYFSIPENLQGTVNNARENTNGYAGFALFSLENIGSYLQSYREVVSFLGSTYFRSRGIHSGYGLYAAGLAINTAVGASEEYPYFSEFWIEKPIKDVREFKIYALMLSNSVTGAYSFTVRPGLSTVIDVESRFFLRKGMAPPTKLGIAPISGMFYYSESTENKPSDYRPEVHNIDGALWQSGDGEWIWRALANPERLGISHFSDSSPKGFGLMQRDANFENYQDLEVRYDKMSSLWIKPKGDWGSGNLELIEIPSKSDKNNNIYCFWIPDKLDLKTQAGDDRPSLSYAYSMYWMDAGITPHLLGRAVSTKVRRDQSNGQATFTLDFAGVALAEIPADTGLSSIITIPEGAKFIEKNLSKDNETGIWRLEFKVELPQTGGVVDSIMQARDGFPRLRVSALLKRGENIAEPLTETWVYDIP